MDTLRSTDPALLGLAQDFRESLRLSVYLARRLDSEGELSAVQVSTLKMLFDGGVRVGEIARNLGVRVPSATEQIIKLEKAGLVGREQDPDDSRAVQVAITEAGRTAVEEANRKRNAAVASILENLDDGERAALVAALPVIAKINSAG